MLSLILLTHNPGLQAREFVEALLTQTRQPDEFLVVDSSSQDGSLPVFEAASGRIHQIPQSEFDHGATRNLALRLTRGDVALFMTQDAILTHPESLARLYDAFDDHRVAVAYGRQLPRPDASHFATHIRRFNYPESSSVRDLSAIEHQGVRAAFCSNSFAAYRRRAIEAVGGFPAPSIVSEDLWAGLKLLLDGWRIAYVSQATVVHSHNHSALEELKVLFDIGVSHTAQRALLQRLGSPSGEGRRFVRSELQYLRANGQRGALLHWFLRNAARSTGYQLGRHHQLLPLAVKRALSMWAGYWQSSRQ